MSAVKSASQVYKEIKQHAESIANSEPQRFPEAASGKDFFRQGDIYIWRFENFLTERKEGGKVTVSPPENYEEVKDFSPQVAIGETQGARHVFDSVQGVRAFRNTKADALQGLVYVTTSERVLTHPEHGHLICPPSAREVGGEMVYDAYRVTFQRAMAAELARVRD